MNSFKIRQYARLMKSESIMHRNTIVRTTWISLIFCSLVTSIRAQDSPRGFGEETVSLSGTITGAVSFHSPYVSSHIGEVDMSETILSTPLYHARFGSIHFITGLNASWTRFNFTDYEPTYSEDLVHVLKTEDLYGLGVYAAIMRPLTDRTGWSVSVMPGLYSSFRSPRPGEEKIVAHGELESRLSDTWILSAGVAYDSAFGKPRIYPMGGAIWRPKEDLTVRLVLPSPSVYWAATERTGLFLAIYPAGDRWSMYDDDRRKTVFTAESWRTAIGAEWNMVDEIWVRMMSGMDTNREYDAQCSYAADVSSNVEDTWFATIALVIY